MASGRSSPADRFQQDGVVFPLPALSDEELTAARTGFAQLEQALDAPPKNFRYPHLHFAWARRLVNHPPLLDQVAEVLGGELIVISSLILHKPPQTPDYVGWHQDGTYWRLHEATTASAWIALTAADPDNGCMRVIPGSHRRPILPHRESHDELSLLGRGEEVAVSVDDTEAVDVTLAPGQMSMHHNSILHSSPPNPSGRPRTGFIIRFVTPAFRSGSGAAMVVRGGRLPPNMTASQEQASEDTTQALNWHHQYLSALDPPHGN